MLSLFHLLLFRIPSCWSSISSRHRLHERRLYTVLCIGEFRDPFLLPLNPKSDQLLISPHNVTPESHNKVTRTEEIIAK